MKIVNRLYIPYAGWGVLAGSFVCAGLAVGFTIYIFGLFVVPVSEEFGLSRANANNGMIAFQLGTAILSPLVGRFMDRVSARLMVVVGGLAFGSALMVASITDSLWLMLLMITIPLAFGCAACGVLGANTIVVRWFSKRRGRALGVLALSTSAGGIISQPVTALLIENFGWRTALFQIGLGATLLFVLMALWFIRNAPKGTERGYQQEFGVKDDKASDFETTSSVSEAPRERLWTYRDLVRSRNFWLMAFGIGLLQASDQAVLISQVPHFLDLGFDMTTAALLVSIKTLSAVGGKIIVGYLADKVDLRWLFFYVAGSNVLLLAVYMSQPSLWLLFATVSLLGVAVGGVFPVWTTMMAWLFGARSFGSVMGIMMIISSPMTMISLRFVGEIHDRTGTYVPAFGVFIGVVIVAVLLILRLKPEQAAAVS
jgi:MFS family permease